MHIAPVHCAFPLVLLLAAAGAFAQFTDAGADREALPTVPDDMRCRLYAREPMVRHPCAIAFDRRGRMFVGMGPQWRNPKPDTPGDSVVIVLDMDGDGRADTTKTFATGFNSVQGLAWRGRDLYVANAPDFTLVRDTDGDDVADEYICLYTDLGNLEHGLHGLNFGPDGKLYMSKGNSKGLTKPGRIAPKPFRELWGVTAPADTPDHPEPKHFTRENYQRAYHDPADDWGKHGGILRCDADGRNLEIISRGFRNPWDIAYDAGFNWIGTDNDQTTGDRVFMPFHGAHFGWNHAWSSHWSDEPHPPTAPVSGPLFEGSGTGVVFCDSPMLPQKYRGVFLVNDWLSKKTYIWRPQWDGALMKPKGGAFEPFIDGGKSLYRPTDIAIGPDAAIYILGWGSGYGSDLDKGQMTSAGRIFRIAPEQWKESPWNTPHRRKPLSEWSVDDLLDDFFSPLPANRIDAQDELVRRGGDIAPTLMRHLDDGMVELAETWTAWTLGRMRLGDAEITKYFQMQVTKDAGPSVNKRVQSLRILAHRARLVKNGSLDTATLEAGLSHKEPRVRLAAVEAVAATPSRSHIAPLLALLASETDRTVFYAGWQALRMQAPVDDLRPLLRDERGGVRRAALLALLETGSLQRAERDSLAGDIDPGVREVMALASGAKSPASRPAAARAAPPPTGVALIRNLKAHSASTYRYVTGGLQAGLPNFTDRDYLLKHVPAELDGADLIATANADDGSTGKDFITFDAIVPVRVTVGIDTRITAPPAWLKDGFTARSEQIGADHWKYRLFSRDFEAGPVTLGGNTDDGKGGGKSHYLIAIEPLPLAPQPSATTIEQATKLLGKGDAQRGEVLFKHRGGAGCMKCHSVGEKSNALGPQLADIGQRATAAHIVQSILEPSAVITTGFTTQVVETDSDETITGILMEESDLALTLGLPTGETRTIRKPTITSQRSSSTSAMPVLAQSLSPQQVADLVAFLLTQKTTPVHPASGKTTPPTQTPNATSPSATTTTNNTAAVTAQSIESGDWKITTDPAQHQAIITFKGTPVATYVWQDRDTLRPYFKSIKTLTGAQLTRPHPPGAGEDTDHHTMHPGIWLGFGDINGTDFWRNKGRVVQEKNTLIKTENEAVGFDVVNRYEKPDGAVVCRQWCSYRFIADDAGYVLLIDSRISGDTDLTFGKQEEMGLGIRVPRALTVKSGSGAIVSDTGGENEKGTWGKVGKWWDYHGKLNGKSVGLLVMSAGVNGEVWSHSRDYGVLVANPVHRKPLTVEKGKELRLVFGVLVHESDDVKKLDRAAAYRRFEERVKKMIGLP